jgi:hypothetical protein
LLLPAGFVLSPAGCAPAGGWPYLFVCFLSKQCRFGQFARERVRIAVKTVRFSFVFFCFVPDLWITKQLARSGLSSGNCFQNLVVMKRIVAIEILSTLLLFLFGYTAFSKLMDYARFAGALARLPVISRGAGALAVAVPLAELVIVLLLLFPSTRLKGLYGSLGLLSVFTVYLVYLLLFVPHLPCACGGVIGALGWKGHVALNVGLIGVTVWGIRLLGY